ncbi:hypothetical protein [Mesorhizobium sp. LjNodule214]|uniref:hypothetical protein n=1 Tax=Mesorhizobium sp. LjNodule214 TaxID=3342252 RepID=UPI003ECCF377
MTVAAEKTERGIAPRAFWRGKALAILLVAVGLATFAVANGHFLYVAIMSQPDCVPHSKVSRSAIPGGLYQAADPAC